MSIQSSIQSDTMKQEEDIKNYINKIVDELLHKDKVYVCNINEKKINGVYDSITIDFDKV